MSLVFIQPGRAMAVAAGRLGLYQPISSQATPRDPPPEAQWLSEAVVSPRGWWDASTPLALLSVDGTPTTNWGTPVRALLDQSGNNRTLLPFYSRQQSPLAWGESHLAGLLGGVGFPTGNIALLQPALHPDCGWKPSDLPATSGWTWYLVWSRPNWRQGTDVDASPVTLLSIGDRPVLQADSRGGNNQLILFPGPGQTILKSDLARRHTHSVIIRYSPAVGADVWIDGVSVARSVSWAGAISTGLVLVLHDGTSSGAAQCWFHEAAEWDRSISDSEVNSIKSYSKRWTTGSRRGLYLIVNGQSNAINYSINDGAANLLARGVAWYLGALAHNVLATTGLPENYTMQSGHGLYAVAGTGYPGSFVMDPGDESDPSNWSLGVDGHAVQRAIASLPTEDVSDVCAIVWPWNETDSLRQYGDHERFQAAAIRFISLLRTMLGDTSNKIPLIWWNAIPYGSPDGIMMHRQVVQSLAGNPDYNVVVGNPQTTDSNPRGSTWDATSGLSFGGDPAHRDSVDNQRFAMLASPVVARALNRNGHSDSITTLPDMLPKAGGPSIQHVYRQNDSTLILTIAHDSGTDITIPLQAAGGIGFVVMDGGSLGAAGPTITASACVRIDPTHLRITLSQPLQNASALCRLFYPYGNASIGRGNAVTDNFSTLTMPVGWNAAFDLGSSWKLDFPLAATFSGVALSDNPL